MTGSRRNEKRDMGFFLSTGATDIIFPFVAVPIARSDFRARGGHTGVTVEPDDKRFWT